MQYRLSFILVLLAATILIFSNRETAAGSITGYVRDLGKTPPKNGISGAMVSLRPMNGEPRNPDEITDAEGLYTIPKVANGHYKIVVKKTGYNPYPHERIKIKVDGDIQVVDVKLVECYGASEYFSKVAKYMLAKADTVPINEQPKVISAEWGNWTMNMPPSSKAMLASELNKYDENSKEMVADIKVYFEANPENIKKAETMFRLAFAGKRNIPDKDSLKYLNVNDLIIGDVASFQIGKSPEDMKNVYSDGFLIRWEDTQASKRFLNNWQPTPDPTTSPPGIEAWQPTPDPTTSPPGIEAWQPTPDPTTSPPGIEAWQPTSDPTTSPPGIEAWQPTSDPTTSPPGIEAWQPTPDPTTSPPGIEAGPKTRP